MDLVYFPKWQARVVINAGGPRVRKGLSTFDYHREHTVWCRGTSLDDLFSRWAGYMDGLARRSFEVNFWGLERNVRAVMPGMRARGHGSLAVMLSLAGLYDWVLQGRVRN
jgi:NAD(P)-dependent dehydrogenase (short-subunit alcohol dehydrogenase family)